MNTSIIYFSGRAELNLDSELFPPELTTPKEKLNYWVKGAEKDPLMAMECVDIDWIISGKVKDDSAE